MAQTGDETLREKMSVFEQIKSRFEPDRLNTLNQRVIMDDSFQARMPDQNTPILSS